jgi:excisionase family DNA binding protein
MELEAVGTDRGALVPDDGSEKMTLRDAAVLCGVDYDTILSWVRKGALPHVVSGPYGTKRVYRRDVERLIRPGAVQD